MASLNPFYNGVLIRRLAMKQAISYNLTSEVKMQTDIESIEPRLSKLEAGQVKMQADIENLKLR